MSKHNEVAEALCAQLRLIRTNKGYATDAGRHLFRGKATALSSEQIPACILFEDEEEILSQKGQPVTCQVRVPYVAELTVECDPENPNIAAHAAASDVCRVLWPDPQPPALKALLNEPPAYAGRHILPRKEGQNLVTVQVKFNATFVFNPGNP